MSCVDSTRCKRGSEALEVGEKGSDTSLNLEPLCERPENEGFNTFLYLLNNDRDQPRNSGVI